MINIKLLTTKAVKGPSTKENECLSWLILICKTVEPQQIAASPQLLAALVNTQNISHEANQQKHHNDNKHLFRQEKWRTMNTQQLTFQNLISNGQNDYQKLPNENQLNHLLLRQR